MTIIDSHVHILPDRVRQRLAEVGAADAWFAACHAGEARVASAETLVAVMERDGIDRALCFSWPFRDPAVCREANDYVADAVARHPGRLIGAMVVQPSDPSSVAEIERCLRRGLCAVGELNSDAQGWEWQEGGPDDGIHAVAAACAHHHMPLTLHCSEPVGHDYAGKGTATPGRVSLLAQRHPDTPFVLAHLGGGLPLYAHMPEIKTLCRRLWFDTAAQPFLYEPSVYRTLAGFGLADRLLYGSDHPLLDAARCIAQIESSGITADDMTAILGGNAARLFAGTRGM